MLEKTLVLMGMLALAGVLHMGKIPPKYNPLGICNSGLGETTARMISVSMNKAWHGGKLKRPTPAYPMEINRFVDSLYVAHTNIHNPNYAPMLSEITQTLQDCEDQLRFAFELSTSNITAYQAYTYFLTSKALFPELPGLGHHEESETEHHEDNHPDIHNIAAAWNKGLRYQRAREITHKALASYRTNDPQQSLAAAWAWFNLWMLDSNEGTKKINSKPYSEKMYYFLQTSDQLRQSMIQNGTWTLLPNSYRADYENIREIVTFLEKNILH